MATKIDKDAIEAAILSRVRIDIKKGEKETYTKEEICDLLDNYIEAIHNSND
ncbi:MAG: hypothetical protein IJ679_12010 [Lachnospiraceae bacterium]|nr:hypothetical protein [Lachnospiraceae bacterium]